MSSRDFIFIFFLLLMVVDYRAQGSVWKMAPVLLQRLGSISFNSSRLRMIAGKLLLCAVTFEGALLGSGRMLMIGLLP